MLKSLIFLSIGLVLATLAGDRIDLTVRGDETPKPPSTSKRATPPEEAEYRALEGWWDLSEAVTSALGTKKTDRLYASIRIEFVPRYSAPDDEPLAEDDDYLREVIRKDAPKRGHSVIAIGRLWTIPAGDPKRDPYKRALTLTYRPGKTCLWVVEMFVGALEAPLSYTPGNTRADDLLTLQYPGVAWAFQRRAEPARPAPGARP